MIRGHSTKSFSAEKILALVQRRLRGTWRKPLDLLCRLRNSASPLGGGTPGGRSDRGAVLIIFILAMILILSISALVLDLGALLIHKGEAVKAAEMCASRAVAEMYRPDYVDLVLPPGDSAAIPGLDPDKWWSQFRETVARNAARNLGLGHVAGWTAAHAPYVPNIQLNANNLAAGDVRIGNWTKAAGAPFAFTAGPADVLVNASLARAMQVTVRRTNLGAVAGVSEGGNPIPLQFAEVFGALLGLEVETPVTVKLDPAAIIGTGAVLPMSDGDTAVTGAMPLALKHVGTVRRVRPGPVADIPTTTWITTNDPAMMVQIRITRDGTAAAGQGVAYAGTLYLVSYASPLGGTPQDRIQRRLRFLAQKFVPPPAGTQEPPPQVWLSMPLNGPGQGDGGALNNGQMNQIWNNFFNPTGDDDFVNRTFVVPVVMNGGANNRQTIGFVRLYCEGARRRGGGGGGGGGGADRWFELDLRLAPSASARNSGTTNTLARLGVPVVPPAAILNAHYNLFWITDAIDGIRVGPRLFGVACASKTSRFHR